MAALAILTGTSAPPSHAPAARPQIIPTPWVDCSGEGAASYVVHVPSPYRKYNKSAMPITEDRDRYPEMAIGQNGFQHRNSFELDYGSCEIPAMSIPSAF